MRELFCGSCGTFYSITKIHTCTDRKAKIKKVKKKVKAARDIVFDLI